ncbi:MAG: DUF2950 domain-containing protein [Deltaproteobacteria bacterium]|nr:DUF2950 domain-containing protein [Deltaproteobacteria bacterium]
MLITMIVLTAVSDWSLAVAEQQYFSSPQQAIAALTGAIEQGDDTKLLDILGAGANDLISSGDKVADQNGKARFLKAYQMSNGLEQEHEGQMRLLIGHKNYPFPIPIVRRDNAWFFDTQAGMEEILNRRIGRNELHTIQVMQAYTNAQREYACLVRDAGTPVFAKKLASNPGARDGLYWETAEGEAESPFGPLVAKAAKKGYSFGLNGGTDNPFHGYFFKILKSQGEHATGGAFDYVIGDKMILGFAMVAYPAKYGASGIMSFIVNQEGLVYEKDLGENTSVVAEAMTAFDPDGSWKKYEEISEP